MLSTDSNQLAAFTALQLEQQCDCSVTERTAMLQQRDRCQYLSDTAKLSIKMSKHVC